MNLPHLDRFCFHLDLDLANNFLIHFEGLVLENKTRSSVSTKYLETLMFENLFPTPGKHFYLKGRLPVRQTS